jgi:hypothetical protein
LKRDSVASRTALYLAASMARLDERKIEETSPG